uniref:Uncharacterized protein n=1 Tax=Vitis vinifera TaxID=29760 RepID=A5BM10_VITVI|nr:hypothetical protein VITISV_012087 [Vitis vinifera]
MWQKAWLTMVVVEGDDIIPEQGAVERVVACGRRKKNTEHRKEGLGTRIEREKIGGQKKVWEQISQSRKVAAARNQAIREENVQRNYIRLTFHPDTSAANSIRNSSPPTFHPDISAQLYLIDIPPGYLSRHSIRPTPHFHPDVSQPSFYPANVPPYPDVSQPPFYPADTPLPLGCLTAAILSGQRSALSGCLTAAILSGHILPYPDASQPQFYPVGIPLYPDVSQPQFYLTDVPPSPDISHPAPTAEWERRTIQLPIELTVDPQFCPFSTCL